MKINQQLLDPSILFEDLSPGDVFKNERYVYLKTENSEEFNAVNLNDGFLTWFSNLQKVCPLPYTEVTLSK